VHDRAVGHEEAAFVLQDPSGVLDVVAPEEVLLVR
jgi:hypothetical protein